MKKILLFYSIIFFAFIPKTYSQDTSNNYIQGIIGTDFDNARYFKLEVGRKISFVEAGIGFSHSSNLPFKKSNASVHIDNGNILSTYNANDLYGKQYFSLMVNAKVNLLHFLLKQKKHQLMLGGSLGVSDGLKVMQYFENDNKKVAMDTDRYIGIDNSVNLTYQYQICNKYALGITAEMISIPEFLIFGISVKRYF